MQEPTYTVRLMKEDDVHQVTEIDREVFPTEWMFRLSSSYQKEFKNPLAHYLVASTCSDIFPEPCPAIATQLPLFRNFFNSMHHAARGGKETQSPYIVGFAGLWMMAHNAHIMSLAVRDRYRGEGIGEALLISIIELAIRLDANMLTLEVRASNDIAQALYEKHGFRAAGYRPRYYSDNGEDAVIMNTNSITSDSFQSFFRSLKEEHLQRYNHITLKIS
ncbi:MAG: ribosomal protein S18-alanine N-acetyltransferase [Dehalococcoidia bacterium]|nr:ribosomal protein S18-alanine N-acetyltransferase [Dehalococcoidia bacterium]